MNVTQIVLKAFEEDPEGGALLMDEVVSGYLAEQAVPEWQATLDAFLLKLRSELTFDGEIGFGYTVWASATDLGHWTAVGVPNEASPGTFQFTDLSAANVRLYRVSRP